MKKIINNIDKSLSTHVYYEKFKIFSYSSNEEEILFFSFSSFESKDIKKSKSNFNSVYQIKFLYIGKYKKQFDKKAIKIDEIIPDPTFKN